MPKEVKESITVHSIVAEVANADTWQDKICILGRAIRQRKSSIANQEAQLAELEPLAATILEANDEDEYLFARTQIRLDYTLTLGTNEKGIGKYEDVVKFLGQESADRLYTKVETVVPEHTETSFTLDKAKVKELTKSEKRKLVKVLRSKAKLYAGPPSLRAKKGKSRHKTS